MKEIIAYIIKWRRFCDRLTPAGDTAEIRHVVQLITKKGFAWTNYFIVVTIELTVHWVRDNTMFNAWIA